MDKRYRKAIVAGNWKMNKLASEVPDFVAQLQGAWRPADQVELALCVPFPFLPIAVEKASPLGIAVGAQDVSFQKSGAYTGEVSAAMLADLKVSYGIIGHSERRAYHGETDKDVNGKLHALLGAGIRPILCVGESLDQRDGGQTLSFVAQQVTAGLQGVDAQSLSQVVVAYEPIWAIGTGRTATAQQAQEVCGHIRQTIASLYGEEAARGVSILYGGSMNEENAQGLLAQPDIDGGLIGGASLKPLALASIAEKAGAHE
jgi:triosephosphate isomerase